MCPTRRRRKRIVTGSIVDVHVHAFPDSLAPRAVEHLAQRAGTAPFLDGTVTDLLRSMDRSGIGVSVVCSVATSPRQVETILEWSRAVAGPRLVPFPSLLPLAEKSLEDLDRIRAGGFAGIKLHPEYQDFHIDDPSLADFYGSVEEAGLVILFHAGFDIGYPDSDRSSPARIARVHESFPGLRLIASHLGGFRQWEDVLRHLAGSDVYLDTSYVFGHIPDAMLREILGAHRSDRILFGSDSPWADQSESLLHVRALGLDDRRETQILRLNAEKLLNLDPRADEGLSGP